METSSPIKSFMPVKQKSAPLNSLSSGIPSFELERKKDPSGQNSYNRKTSEDST